MAKIRVYFDNSAYNIPFEEPFDYTKWSRKHYEDVDLHEFNMRAVEYDRKNPVIRE